MREAQREIIFDDADIAVAQASRKSVVAKADVRHRRSRRMRLVSRLRVFLCRAFRIC